MIYQTKIMVVQVAHHKKHKELAFSDSRIDTITVVAHEIAHTAYDGSH